MDLLGALQWGTSILKYPHASNKYPHFLYMQLADDNSSIVWYSKKKRLGDRTIRISQIEDIIDGQKTKSFQIQPDPSKEDASFSVVYAGGKTLDVIAKSATEAMMWKKGLKHLVSQLKLGVDIRNLKDKPIIRQQIDNMFADTHGAQAVEAEKLKHMQKQADGIREHLAKLKKLGRIFATVNSPYSHRIKCIIMDLENLTMRLERKLADNCLEHNFLWSLAVDTLVFKRMLEVLRKQKPSKGHEMP